MALLMILPRHKTLEIVEAISLHFFFEIRDFFFRDFFFEIFFLFEIVPWEL